MSKKYFFGVTFLALMLGITTSVFAGAYASYYNKQFKFGFTYPKSWSFHKPEDTVIIAHGDHFQKSANGVNASNELATVALPKNAYPHTNLNQAYATVAASDIVASANACKLYTDNGGDVKTMKTKYRVGKNVFYTARIGGAAAGTISDTKIYHIFHKGDCFEVSLNVFTGNIDNYPKGTVKAVNEKRVFNQLATVLQKFYFTK